MMFFPDPLFIATILIIKQQPSTVMTQCGSVMMISSCWSMCVCVSVKQFVCVSIKLFPIHFPDLMSHNGHFLLLSLFYLSFCLSCLYKCMSTTSLLNCQQSHKRQSASCSSFRGEKMKSRLRQYLYACICYSR